MHHTADARLGDRRAVGARAHTRGDHVAPAAVAADVLLVALLVLPRSGSAKHGCPSGASRDSGLVEGESAPVCTRNYNREWQNFFQPKWPRVSRKQVMDFGHQLSNRYGQSVGF
jgi:hypothetical protein